MTDSDDRRRKVVMSDDDRALIGSRARSVSGEIDTADTIPNVDEADLTPVGTFANRYNDPEVRRLAIDLDRRNAYRVMQSMARAPLAETDRDRIEGEIERLRRRQHDVERQAADALKATALHSVEDRGAFKRIDDVLADIDKREEKREKQDAKSRTARIAAAGTIGAALITAAIAYYKVAIEKGEENATQRAVVERVRELDAELDEVRALLWRLFTSPFTPGRPAGDAP